MAFVSTVVANTGNVKGRGLKFDGYSLEVQAFAKSGGDTTGTVTGSALRRIDAIYVFGTDGVAIAAGATITNSSATAPSVALTSLGAGVGGTILLKGSKR